MFRRRFCRFRVQVVRTLKLLILFLLQCTFYSFRNFWLTVWWQLPSFLILFHVLSNSTWSSLTMLSINFIISGSDVAERAVDAEVDHHMKMKGGKEIPLGLHNVPKIPENIILYHRLLLVSEVKSSLSLLGISVMALNWLQAISISTNLFRRRTLTVLLLNSLQTCRSSITGRSTITVNGRFSMERNVYCMPTRPINTRTDDMLATKLETSLFTTIIFVSKTNIKI